MSVNKSKPHVFVLPEDDANRQIANGFRLDVSSRQFYVLAVAGGWHRVLDTFCEDQVGDMERFPTRLMVLLVDCDNKENRIHAVKSRVPSRLTDRVFVLGTLSEPEDLKSDLGTYETIGKELAKDCREGTEKTWSHPLLKHNASEVLRFRERVGPILFS